MKVKHSKFKNTAILFELLVKQITHEVLSNSKKAVSESIIKEFFNSKKELAKELKLYNQLVREKYTRLDDAKLFLEQIIVERKGLDEGKLNREKYNLIKSIKENYDLQKFLSSNLQNYRLLASIYKVFETKTVGKKIDIREYIDSNNLVLEHITSSKLSNQKKEEIYETFKQQSEDLRLLTYKLLVENFNKKYSNLDEAQKNILREFINNVSNTSTFSAYIKEQTDRLLLSLLKEVTDINDKVTKIKVKELAKVLRAEKFLKEKQDKQVSVLMLGNELLKEIKNVKASRASEK